MRKTVLLIFVPFYCFVQKGLFTTNPNFPLDLLLFKLFEKNKLTDYFCAPFWDSHLLTKKRIFQWITQKCFKTTEKHCLLVCGSFWGDFFIKLAHKCFGTTGKYNLAVCDSFCWEKQFLLILVPFYCFVKIGFFTTNPNYPLDLPLFKLVEKNKLSDYFNASFWDSHLFD